HKHQSVLRSLCEPDQAPCYTQNILELDTEVGNRGRLGPFSTNGWKSQLKKTKSQEQHRNMTR
ncbi:hypothetical protein HispidOSU_002215, partial [Sigmodon hispidus]